MNISDLKIAVTAASMIGLTALAHTLEQSQPAQPRPTNPEPRPTNPPPKPSIPTPNSTPQSPPDPNITNPNRNQSDPANPASASGVRNASPFMLAAADGQPRFAENARQLIALEAALERSRVDILRRLGEARQLPAERQTAALMDVVQQMLLNQEHMQSYLVRARSAWSGDIEGTPSTTPLPDPTTPTTPPSTPSTPRR